MASSIKINAGAKPSDFCLELFPKSDIGPLVDSASGVEDDTVSGVSYDDPQNLRVDLFKLDRMVQMDRFLDELSSHPFFSFLSFRRTTRIAS